MYKYIFFLLLFVIQSCSNPNKSSRKTDSDFLAYYNTFYMAEKYYDEALEIIKVNQADIIPKEADVLLNKSIENALVIEQKFYNSQYLDDSYYILGMSSYFKNNITSSEHYFNRILTEHKQSKFYNTTLIMFGYLYLKMDRINELEDLIAKINNELKLNKDDKYLFHLLLADYHKYLDNPEEIEKNYKLSLDNCSDKNDRIYIFYKLLELSESTKNFDKAVKYIDEIQTILSDQKIDKELLQKWIDYNIDIKNYDKVVELLRDYINRENVLKTKIYYETELANVFLYQEKYKDSKQILERLINEYEENSMLKKDLGKTYYLLGNINLEYDWNFDESKSAYQECMNISKTTYYGKESENKINSITSYLNFQDEIFYITSLVDDNQVIDDDLLSQPIVVDYNGLDSLIFNSGQILYFDLGAKDSALFKFKNIVSNYPESKFHYKSLLILDMDEPNSNWKNILESDYGTLDTNESGMTHIDFLIDKSWSLLSQSSEVAIDSLLNIYNTYDSQKSLYIIGFIYDDYLKDIDNAILYYRMYLNKYDQGEFSVKINDRLLEIEDMIDIRIEYYEQRVNLKKGKRWFENKLNIDSSLYYINLASNGIERDIKIYSNNISESIRSYQVNNTLLENNYVAIDSVKLNIAHILYKDLSFDLFAKKYYKDVLSISNSENYINESYACLSLIENNQEWDSLLFSNLNDSNLYNILKNNAQRKFQYNFDRPLELDSLDLSWFNKIKEKHFLKTEENNLEIE